MKMFNVVCKIIEVRVNLYTLQKGGGAAYAQTTPPSCEIGFSLSVNRPFTRPKQLVSHQNRTTVRALEHRYKRKLKNSSSCIYG